MTTPKLAKWTKHRNGDFTLRDARSEAKLGTVNHHPHRSTWIITDFTKSPSIIAEEEFRKRATGLLLTMTGYELCL